MNVEVFKKADISKYANGKHIRLVNLGPIVLFSNFKLTTCSRKHLDDTRVHIVSLMHKLLTSSKGSDDLSNGFDRDRGRRQQELTNNKKLEGNFILELRSQMFLVLSKIKEKLLTD